CSPASVFSWRCIHGGSSWAPEASTDFNLTDWRHALFAALSCAPFVAHCASVQPAPAAAGTSLAEPAASAGASAPAEPPAAPPAATPPAAAPTPAPSVPAPAPAPARAPGVTGTPPPAATSTAPPEQPIAVPFDVHRPEIAAWIDEVAGHDGWSRKKVVALL